MALPQIEGGLKDKTRKVYAEIPAESYLNFEMEASRRGVTPYRLASAIIAEYLAGGLVEQQPGTDRKEGF
ncbi:hypothetical protein SAMN03097708_00845 [Thiohalomonas denitrificans]|uniref:Uncharacterized protein n=2 Tax=Thiohalomonas denitrificans TaxID=415747 RepID=A0A1G5PVB5_9GAMM|nr:hypothetical protein SAMN03097708_00845 [Thiohalomonas denitrificans]